MNIETYRKDLGILVEDKINEAISLMPPQYLFRNDKDLKLYIPKIAIEYLLEHLSDTVNVKYEKANLKFRGYDIIEGYEFCIVFVHESYPIYNNNSLIKVKL